ncbi:MAG: tetratricopeptide repeat protein [Actinomycetota bacterium]|nr:tetratricopeptide repeat protein [Actinomycetota bacterium]
MDVEDTITDLRQRLRRYGPDRYPIQHATAQFHLGVALLSAGQADEAAAALRAAAAIFDPDRLPVEHAKATNMLGAALRQLGELKEAAEAFQGAAKTFEAHSQEQEHAAALFNLGLVQRESGDAEAASECFRQAWTRFAEHRLPGQATSAARELGTTLLARGELDAAADTLAQATDLAAQVGDYAAVGSAANALGLAHLGLGRTQEALEAFRQAAVAHPRTVRPEGFAMAKANLAIAYEQDGDGPRARLAARQALAVGDAPEPVRVQASGVLERLGTQADDLLVVLDQEPADRWAPIVREEVVRWADEDPDQRRAALGAWVDGQVARPDRGADLAEAWLDVLLELPPEVFETMIRATLEVLPERDEATVDRFRSDVSRAMVRFHVPQWLRLKDTFNRIAGELDQEPSWG